jgi:hypothetical protein
MHRLVKVGNQFMKDYYFLSCPHGHIIGFEEAPSFTFHLSDTPKKQHIIKHDTYLLLLDVISRNPGSTLAWVKVLYEEKILFVSSTFLEEI